MAHQIVLTDLGPSSVTPEQFKLAFRHHAAGVAVITGDDGSGPVAITVSSVFSVSAEPPALVFSLSNTSSAAPHLLAAGKVVVHLLAPEHAQIAVNAATHGANRFGDDVAWDRLPTGEPYYTDVHTWLRGEIVEQIVIGGSTLVVVHVLETHLASDQEPNRALLYHNRKWAGLTQDSYFER
ncbi:MAG: flavin reductase family protein [Agromyces sp.]